MRDAYNRRQFLGATVAGAALGIGTSAVSAHAPLSQTGASQAGSPTEIPTEVPTASQAAPVSGYTAPEFAAVRTAFEACFSDLGELGASVCVMMEGREVLNLWGGYEDLAKTRLWHRDTLVAPASSIKGLFPFCVHKLVQDGRIAYDDLVTKYWPEFGQNGKDAITIRHVLSHMSGLEQTFPANVYGMPTADLFPVIEAATPKAKPGSYGAYHSQTHMPLVAALVYKITGEEIYTYFRREIAGPWGIDAWLSLPASEHSRACDMVIPTGSTYYPMMEKLGVIPEAMRGQDFMAAPYTAPLSPFTNGRGFARAYGAIANGGILDGVRLYSETIASNFGKPQWENTNWAGGNEFHDDDEQFGSGLQSGTMGYLRSSKDIPLGPNPDTFGMPGAGGSVGFADPDRKLGFGYTTNSWHEFGAGLGPRLATVIDAVYASLS